MSKSSKTQTKDELIELAMQPVPDDFEPDWPDETFEIEPIHQGMRLVCHYVPKDKDVR